MKINKFLMIYALFLAYKEFINAYVDGISYIHGIYDMIFALFLLIENDIIKRYPQFLYMFPTSLNIIATIIIVERNI
jgi:hypothetical protein